MDAEQMTPATVAHTTMPAAGPNPGEPVTAVAAMEAEVEQKLVRDTAPAPEPEKNVDHGQPTPAAKQELPPGVLALPLGSGDAQKIIHVYPPDEWTSSTQTMLRTGDFDGWAERALATDDDLDVWDSFNDGDGPKIKEINELFTELEKATGQAAGKSRNSRRSSRSGLRR